MEVKAKLRYLRMSPRKVRLVADLVRGKSAQSALDQLQFANKAAAKPVSKLVQSAIANAVNNFSLELNNLFVKEISVDGGPTLKRWMPRAHGRATPIMKRTSHVNIILGEVKDSGVREGKKTKLESPVKLSAAAGENEGIKTSGKDEVLEADSTANNENPVIEHDPRNEGRLGHRRIEGGGKGFTKKSFQRKSG